tara:strand:+ start:3718 stop:4611 length:894 start_codon:yes stop_codon:yes gene_type:complete
VGLLSEIMAIMSAVCWGATGVLLRKTPERHRFSFMLPEGFFSVSLVLILSTIFGAWNDFLLLSSSLIFLSILAACFNILGTFSYVKALNELKIGLTLTVIVSSFILFTMISSKWIFNDSLSFHLILSAIFIIFGVILINLSSSDERNDNFSFRTLLSNYKSLIYCLFAGLLWCSGNLILDQVLENTGVLQVTLIRSLTVLFVYLILSIWFNRFRLSFLYENNSSKFFVLSASFIATLSMLFWFTSLFFGEASLTVILGSSSPIAAIILGRIFLKEKISIYSQIGVISSMVGVVIAII